MNYLDRKRVTNLRRHWVVSESFSHYLSAVNDQGMNAITNLVRGGGSNSHPLRGSTLIDTLQGIPDPKSGKLWVCYSVHGLVWSIFYRKKNKYMYLDRMVNKSTSSVVQEFIELCSSICLDAKTKMLYYGRNNLDNFSNDIVNSAHGALLHMYRYHLSLFNRAKPLTNVWVLTYYPENIDIVDFSHTSKARQRDILTHFSGLASCFTLDQITEKFTLTGQEWSRVFYSWRKLKVPVKIPMGMTEWITRQCFVAKIKGGAGNKLLPNYRPYVKEHFG